MITNQTKFQFIEQNKSPQEALRLLGDPDNHPKKPYGFSGTPTITPRSLTASRGPRQTTPTDLNICRGFNILMRSILSRFFTLLV